MGVHVRGSEKEADQNWRMNKCKKKPAVENIRLECWFTFKHDDGIYIFSHLSDALIQSNLQVTNI